MGIAGSSTTITSSIPLIGSGANVPRTTAISGTDAANLSQRVRIAAGSNPVCSDAGGGLTTVGCPNFVNPMTSQGQVIGGGAARELRKRSRR